MADNDNYALQIALPATADGAMPVAASLDNIKPRRGNLNSIKNKFTHDGVAPNPAHEPDLSNALVLDSRILHPLPSATAMALNGLTGSGVDAWSVQQMEHRNPGDIVIKNYGSTIGASLDSKVEAGATPNGPSHNAAPKQSSVSSVVAFKPM